MDYRKYQFCAKERILIVFESIAVTAVIAFLCYRSVYVMAVSAPTTAPNEMMTTMAMMSR